MSEYITLTRVNKGPRILVKKSDISLVEEDKSDDTCKVIIFDETHWVDDDYDSIMEKLM